MNGILRGEDILERIGSPLALAMTMLRVRLLGSHNEPLNGFLAEMAGRVRRVYDGPISNAWMPIEEVDWSLFDVVAIDSTGAGGTGRPTPTDSVATSTSASRW